MREGKSHGGYNQGDADQKERQSNQATAMPAPKVDIEAIEEPSEFDALGNCDREEKPEIGEQHTREGRNNENKRGYIFPKLNTPEWMTALSAVAATVVACCALGVSIVSCSVTQSQLDEMRSSSMQADQLVAAAVAQAETMKRQQEITVVQLRANVRRETIRYIPVFIGEGAKIGWEVNPIWRNVGSTDARNYVGWWGIRRVEIASLGTETCPRIDRPDILPERIVIAPGEAVIQSAFNLSVEDAVKAARNEIAIFISGHIEYMDIFPGTAPHRSDWCVRVIPNNIEADKMSFFNVREEKE